MMGKVADALAIPLIVLIVAGSLVAVRYIDNISDNSKRDTRTNV